MTVWINDFRIDLRFRQLSIKEKPSAKSTNGTHKPFAESTNANRKSSAESTCDCFSLSGSMTVQSRWTVALPFRMFLPEAIQKMRSCELACLLLTLVDGAASFLKIVDQS